MNFLTAIIDGLVRFVQRNPLTMLLIVILALGAPALLKGIALFILYFLMGLVILVVVLMLAFRWRIYKVRKQMEQQKASDSSPDRRDSAVSARPLQSSRARSAKAR